MAQDWIPELCEEASAPIAERSITHGTSYTSDGDRGDPTFCTMGRQVLQRLKQQGVRAKVSFHGAFKHLHSVPLCVLPETVPKVRP